MAKCVGTSTGGRKCEREARVVAGPAGKVSESIMRDKAAKPLLVKW